MGLEENVIHYSHHKKFNHFNSVLHTFRTQTILWYRYVMREAEMKAAPHKWVLKEYKNRKIVEGSKRRIKRKEENV